MIGRVIKAMHANWHPDCFRCELCKDPLADTGFIKNAGRLVSLYTNMSSFLWFIVIRIMPNISSLPVEYVSALLFKKAENLFIKSFINFNRALCKRCHAAEKAKGISCCFATHFVLKAPTMALLWCLNLSIVVLESFWIGKLIKHIG